MAWMVSSSSRSTGSTPAPEPEVPGEGLGPGFSVKCGAPAAHGGGVLSSSHISVMFLCRRMLHAVWGDLDIDHVVRPLGQVTLCKTQPREEGCLRTSARDYILTHPDWYTASAAAFMGGKAA